MLPRQLVRDVPLNPVVGTRLSPAAEGPVSWAVRGATEQFAEKLGFVGATVEERPFRAA
jgi:hypothetical protein